MTVRLHSVNHDIAILAAYAPGEHTTIHERSEFWTSLRKYLIKLPKRTHVIKGIGANGHIGRETPELYVENDGSTKWNHNGQELADMAQAIKLTTTNTVQTCKNSGARYHGK